MMVFHMNDWKMMARAIGIGASEEEIERMTGPLPALETAFRRALETLDPRVEPAATFDPEIGDPTR